MGLDMFLTKKTFIGGQYEHCNVKGEIKITTGRDDKPINIKLNRLSSVIESVGYWRKANHIHLWFVKNVQEDKDDCERYYVNQEQLSLLLETCKSVLKDNSQADNLLPTQSGFFFGSTQYDEWYFSSIQETADIIGDLLEELKESSGEIYYESSW